MQTASKLIKYARSISDLQNSEFISWDDEVTLLNEAYRDLYSLYTESSGDYWVKEEVIQVTSANLSPNSLSGFEYLIDLPVDFYKIRFLSWNSGGRWSPVKRFSTSFRDNTPSEPYYRILGNKLWIISPIVPQLRLTYYIPPQEITLPDYKINFLESLPEYSLASIKPQYIVDGNKLLYIEGTNNLKVQNIDTGDIFTLYTSVSNLVQVSYSKGWIWWIEANGFAWKASTNFVSTITPVPALRASSSWLINNFLIQNSWIYFSTATETWRIRTDETGAGQIMLSPTNVKDYQLSEGREIYLHNGDLYINGLMITLTGLGRRVYTYLGDIYLLLNDNILYRMQDDNSLVIVKEDVTASGLCNPDGFLPVLQDSVFGLSLIKDYIFDYPSNDTWEMLAYITAIAFVRKQNDQVKMGSLNQRLGELTQRFAQVSKRDEYQFYRINDDISESSTLY